MKDGQQSFEKWKAFKQEMCECFLNTQEGSEAHHKMQPIYYNGYIIQYYIQIETFNRPAKRSEPSLRNIVKRCLDAGINCLQDLVDDNTDEGVIWKMIVWAGQKYNATKRWQKI